MSTPERAPNGGRDNGARHGGRGGRGNGRTPAKGRGGSPFVGQIAGFATLNAGNSGVSPERIQDFLLQFRIRAMANYMPGMEQVFEEGGTYPIIIEPDIPNDPEDRVAFELWRQARREYESKRKRIEEETIKLFGEVLGQCGKQSIELIRRIEGGSDALESKDVLLLVQAIRTSHMVGARADTTENFDAAILKYYNIQMGEYEMLAQYYNRFRATIASLTQTALRAGKEEHVPDEEMQAQRFVATLATPFHDFAQAVSRCMIARPFTLQAAFERAAEFGPNARAPSARSHAVFAATRGGRRSQGQGRGRGRSGDTCNKCGGKGHWARDCPDGKPKDDAEKAQIDKAIKEGREKGDKKGK